MSPIIQMRAAAQFARQAGEIEQQHTGDVGDPLDEITLHVISAIVMAASSLEAFINEVFLNANIYLPQYDKVLKARWPKYEQKKVLDKFQLAMRLRTKKRMDSGVSIYQNADTLILMRNAVVHFKPEWSHEKRIQKRIEQCIQKKFALSPFAHGDSVFPDQCMSYGCARWCVETALAFVDAFCTQSGIENRYLIFSKYLRCFNSSYSRPYQNCRSGKSNSRLIYPPVFDSTPPSGRPRAPGLANRSVPSGLPTASFRPLVRVAPRRPSRPTPEYRGRSCRLADRLAEGSVIGFCSARPPSISGGPVRQRILSGGRRRRRDRVPLSPGGGFSLSPSVPSPLRGRGNGGWPRESGKARTSLGFRRIRPSPCSGPEFHFPAKSPNRKHDFPHYRICVFWSHPKKTQTWRIGNTIFMNYPIQHLTLSAIPDSRRIVITRSRNS